MQVPEKLTLIGGSILLASTLIFTLKSQASSILPKIEHPISSIYDHAGDEQNEINFHDGYQRAQQNGWQTGTWGTAKFYVDDQHNMYMGSGQLQGSFSNVVNDRPIQTINLGESVQAPQDSSFLFADSNYDNVPLTQINGLSHLDTSQTTSMRDMFNNNQSLGNIDLSNFDTHNTTNMEGMFARDSILSNLDISHFDMSKVTDMNYMLENDGTLNRLTLGPNTRLASGAYLPNNYRQGTQTLSLDNNAHPGIWVKQ